MSGTVTLTKDNSNGCLVNEEEYKDLWERVCKIPELCNSQAVVAAPGLTFLNPGTHRRGYLGTDEKVSRCDHVHERRRIDPTPLTPTITVAGSLTSSQTLTLDRWSDDTWIEYAFRVRVNADIGVGWGYIVIPNIGGFQRPIIDLEGTYRNASTAPQIDENSGQGGVGAAPRGPYMGQEYHHWSSTQRLYQGFYRRDNAVQHWVDFRVKYVCL